MTIPANIQSFQDLARWLIATRHEGQPYGMAKTLKVSAGLPYQWRDGLVKIPQRETVERLCHAYGLDFWDVMKLVIGPPPPPKRRRLVPIRGGSGQAQPLPEDTGPNLLRLIGRRLYEWWGSPGPRPAFCRA